MNIVEELQDARKRKSGVEIMCEKISIHVNIRKTRMLECNRQLCYRWRSNRLKQWS